MLPRHESSNEVPALPAHSPGLSSAFPELLSLWEHSHEANQGFIPPWEQLLQRPAAFLHLLFGLQMKIMMIFYLVHYELSKQV